MSRIKKEVVPSSLSLAAGPPYGLLACRIDGAEAHNPVDARDPALVAELGLDPERRALGRGQLWDQDRIGDRAVGDEGAGAELALGDDLVTLAHVAVP